MSEIINKISESGLIQINLEDFIPQGERILFDFKPLLFEELVLKEKDFREFVKTHDWSKYKNKFVAVTCSNDAIIASWAYMLVAVSLQPYARKIIFGNLEQLNEALILEAIEKTDAGNYSEQRVVIKGCGDTKIPVSAFMALTSKLKPVVKSIMYGEPCSTVPVYKRRE